MKKFLIINVFLLSVPLLAGCDKEQTIQKVPEKICKECPQYSPPAPDWCRDGKIIIPKPDECGCANHPICEKIEK